MEQVTFKDIKKSKEVNAYIYKGNSTLGVLGYTAHSAEHAVKVSSMAGKILECLGYGRRTIELAKIAGYMHDIGNCVNRLAHPHSGALMAHHILRDMKMDYEDIAVIINAIGMHDEKSGGAVDTVSAALILADKTDVRRDRVRNQNKAAFDKHDRVNYAVVSSSLDIQKEKKVIKLELKIDENICSMMDYFEIFLQRMLMCRRAASVLSTTFKLNANGNKIC